MHLPSASDERGAEADLRISPAEPLPARSAWYMTAVLCAMLLLSFVDRYSLTLLVDPIKREFALSDLQMGLLIGASFAIFYSVMGVPLGLMVDRLNRRNMVILGVFVWSAMTILSGFASSYPMLLVGRIGVGLGEAVLTPAAFSMIRDAFPAERRARAMSLYLFGANVGTGASLVAVGWLSQLLGGSVWPSSIGLGHFSDWRLVLICIGSVGVPLSLLGLTMREPGRAGSNGAGPTIGEVTRHVAALPLRYAVLAVAFVFWGLSIYSMGAWLPTALSRGWSLPVAQVGKAYGAMAMTLAPVAMVVFPIALDRLIAAGRGREVAVLASGVALLGVAPAVVAPLARTPSLTWLAAGSNILLAMGVQLMVSLMITQVAPARFTGTVSAGCYLLMSLVGLGFGPSLVPIVATRLAAGPHATGHALALVAGAFWLAFALAMFVLWRTLLRGVAPPSAGIVGR